MTKVKIVRDDLTDDEARALAQMCKRMVGMISARCRPAGRRF
jgi:hypothetical protein